METPTQIFLKRTINYFMHGNISAKEAAQIIFNATQSEVTRYDFYKVLEGPTSKNISRKELCQIASKFVDLANSLYEFTPHEFDNPHDIMRSRLVEKAGDVYGKAGAFSKAFNAYREACYEDLDLLVSCMLKYAEAATNAGKRRIAINHYGRIIEYCTEDQNSNEPHIAARGQHFKAIATRRLEELKLKI